MNDVNRFLGGTVAGTLIRLAVISLIVGFILSVLGIHPVDLYHGLVGFFRNLWYRGFDALGEIGSYLLIGASVVIPVFIIIRILSYRR